MTSNSIIKKKHQNSKSGFTLVEAITVAGIFIIIVVTVVNLYLMYSKAQRKANQKQKTLNEISYLIEKMSREIRLREVIFKGDFDYDGDGTNDDALYSKDGGSGISGKENEIALGPADTNYNVYYIFSSNGLGIACANNQKGLYKFTKIATDAYCQKLFNFEGITVENAGFYISPSFNPYPDSDGDCKSNSFDGYYCRCNSNDDCDSGNCIAGTGSGLVGKCQHINQQPRVTINLKIQDNFTNEDIILQTSVSSRIYKR